MSSKNTTYSASYKSQYSWVERSTYGPKYAFCTWCHKHIKLDSMGKSALDSHIKSIKHTDFEKIHEKTLSVSTYYTPTTSQEIKRVSEVVVSQKSVDLNKNIVLNSQEVNSPEIKIAKKSGQNDLKKLLDLRDSTTKAEILWCLQTVKKHYSQRGAADAVSLFPVMFEDSEIAKKMKLQKTKIGYTIVHGLAPFFRRQLQDLLEKSKHIVVGFDESLNKISQTQQMDISVRFWNIKKEEVSTRYFNSVFLSAAKSTDLKEGLKTGVGTKNLNKILQVSMDGPAVNFKMLRELKLDLSQANDNNSVLLEIGSCGLHNVNGAFKAGVKNSGWDLDLFFKALYQLFHNVPARRGSYIQITKSNVFPLKFCSIRWTENSKVAMRADNMISFLQIFVKEVQKEGKKNALNNGHDNFQTVAKFVKDDMIRPKLAFFITVSNLVEPFLNEFQSDDPMAPFLYEDIKFLLTSLVERIVKKEILDNTHVTNIDLKKRENFLKPSQIDLGFETKKALANSKVNEEQIIKFRIASLNFYFGVIEKLFERSPLNYNLTRYISCTNPSVIVKNSSTAEKRLTDCLELLSSKKNWITGLTADKIKSEFKNLCRSQFAIEKMKKYDRKEERLDHFWTKLIADLEGDYTNLYDFLKMIFILSHGNAALERGFSVNSDCLIENQKEESLIGLRIVYDTVTLFEDLKSFPIEKGIIQAARNAHDMCTEHNKKKKAQEQEQEDKNKKNKELEKKRKELDAMKQKILKDAADKASLIDEEMKSILT